MSTIATVVDEDESAIEASPKEHEAETAARVESQMTSRGFAGTVQRSLLVPALVAVIVALIGGVFGLAAVGFNALRDDMNEGFARVDAKFVQVDDRFAEVNAILLDHTERLARIEAVQGARALQ